MSPTVEVAAQEAPSGPPAERALAGDGASVVLVYGGEQEGRVGACACDAYPKGGFGRLAAMTEAVRAADPAVPVLLLNPGGWLSSDNDQGVLAPRAIADDGYVRRALALVPHDALNATWRDLPSLGDVAHTVSATHRLPGIEATRTFDANGLRVVVTGVSRRGPPFLEPEGTAVTPPVDALRALELRDEDLVVVLAYQVGRDAKALAAVPGVDVVIEADDYKARYEPVVVGSAVWVRSWDEATRLGELRLWVEDGHVVRVLDRMIDLGPDVPEPPELKKLAKEQARGK
jgi:hypothetical protein